LSNKTFDKLLATGFIKDVKEATWLSPIVVVLNKHDKLKICVDFKELKVVTKNNLYPLPFTNEVINIVVRYEVYIFLDGFSRYNQILIIPL
jgi:hypothetical protein